MLANLAVLALGLAPGGSVARRRPAGYARTRVLAMAEPVPAIRAVDICTPDVQSLAVFYEACFGMQRSEVSGCVEMGFAGDTTRLKLVETPSGAFRVGEGFDSIALSLPDVGLVVDRVEARGGQVITPPTPHTVGPSKVPDEAMDVTHETLEALITDPQGYRFRLIQRDGTSGHVTKVVLRVTDLEQSKAFYSGLLGMSVLRWRSNLSSSPPSTSLCMQIGDPAVLNGAAVLEESPLSELSAAVLELIYPFDTRKMDVGEGGAGRLTIAASDVHDLATRAPSGSGKLVRSVPGAGDAEVRDPDGFEVRLVKF